MTSVLQPLNSKVQEYAGQMHDASTEISQIDAEIAALLERKRDTEARFMAAKGKHDDYKRQYMGVEMALRGEVQQVQHQQQQQQQQVPFDRRDLDDDQEEDEDE